MGCPQKPKQLRIEKKMANLLINIHGFLSSHESDKVIAFRQSIAHCSDIVFLSPSLPDKPQATVEAIEKLILDNQALFDNISLIGHSLGGYYATYIASKYHLRTILVNPVIRGYEIMCEFFGDSINPHTGVKFEITESDIAYLIGIYLEELPDSTLFLVMQQLEDEITNPQETLAYYRDYKQLVENGGCHDFTGFSQHANNIINFAFGHDAYPA